MEYIAEVSGKGEGESGGNTSNRTPSGFNSMRGNPGRNARAIPTRRKTIAGAIASRFARVAEAPSAVSIRRNVRKPAIIEGSYGAGRDINHQGYERGVEDE